MMVIRFSLYRRKMRMNKNHHPNISIRKLSVMVQNLPRRIIRSIIRVITKKRLRKAKRIRERTNEMLT